MHYSHAIAFVLGMFAGGALVVLAVALVNDPKGRL